MRRPALASALFISVLLLTGATPPDDASTARWTRVLRNLEKALKRSPGSPELNYNAGVARAHLGKNEEARQNLTRALTSRRPSVEAAANYNIGNTLFRSAKTREAQDPQAAAEDLKEALQYYRRALELKQNDRDTRYNYELSDKWLQVLLKRPLPPPQGGGGGAKNKNEEDKDKKPSPPQGSPQQPPDAQPRPPDPSAPSGREREKELSREEARMLVETYGQEGPRDETDMNKTRTDAPVDKDW